MRRTLIVLAAAALFVGAGAAWSSQGSGDPLDAVAGGGTFGPGCWDGPNPDPPCFGTRRDFSIDAHGGPKGQNATGFQYYGRQDGAGAAPRRDVQCMRVAGNVAVVGGTYIQSTANGDELWGWAMRLEDNGPPGPGPDDRSSATFVDALGNWPEDFPQVCPAIDESYFVANGYQPLHSGDIVVHDGNG